MNKSVESNKKSMIKMYNDIINNLSEDLRYYVAVFNDKKQWLLSVGFTHEIDWYESKIAELQKSIKETAKERDLCESRFGINVA